MRLHPGPDGNECFIVELDPGHQGMQRFYDLLFSKSGSAYESLLLLEEFYE